MADESVGQWIAAARGGSREALGTVLEACRQYLLLVANRESDPRLKAKVGASDVVQETLLEAHRDFHQFRGESERELLAWLRRLLLNNLLNQKRHFQGTRQRDVSREVPWDSAIVARQTQGDLSPSNIFAANEEREVIEAATAKLPPHYREILDLRHRQGLSFVEIGRQKGQSPDAVRMLWWRAFERLASVINGDV